MFFVLAIATLSICLVGCDPKPYQVSRSLEINAPANHVYGIVADHSKRVEWSPWEQIDPDMKKEVTGEAGAVGSKWSWSSENDEVGTGTLETKEVRANEYIKSNLIFTSPFEASSTVEWEFNEQNGVTTATWKNSGELPGMVAMFTDMEETLGPSFEKGLEGLKTLSESTYKEPKQTILEEAADVVEDAKEMIEEVKETM